MERRYLKVAVELDRFTSGPALSFKQHRFSTGIDSVCCIPGLFQVLKGSYHTYFYHLIIFPEVHL